MPIVAFYEFGVKDGIRLTGLPDPLLHLLVGCALFLLIAAGLRRPLSSWMPLAAVIGVELANECADRVRWGSWLGWSTVGDVAITLALPLLLFLLARQAERSRVQMSAQPSPSA